MGIFNKKCLNHEIKIKFYIVTQLSLLNIWMLLISLYRLNLLVSKANRQHIMYRIIFKKMIHVTCEQPHRDDVKHIFVHT